MGLPTKIVGTMLDSNGLGTSRWCVKYPEAYKDLLEYRQDFEQIVREILTDHLNGQIKDLRE